jgi:hypothetical protein
MMLPISVRLNRWVLYFVCIMVVCPTKEQISDATTVRKSSFERSIRTLPVQNCLRTIRFKIWSYSEGIDRKGFQLVIASVGAEHFNAVDMRALARHLNETFSSVNKVKVGLFIDEQFAELVARGVVEPHEIPSKQKGLYELDRTRPFERIRYSVGKGSTNREYSITLRSRARAR